MDPNHPYYQQKQGQPLPSQQTLQPPSFVPFYQQQPQPPPLQFQPQQPPPQSQTSPPVYMHAQPQTSDLQHFHSYQPNVQNIASPQYYDNPDMPPRQPAPPHMLFDQELSRGPSEIFNKELSRGASGIFDRGQISAPGMQPPQSAGIYDYDVSRGSSMPFPQQQQPQSAGMFEIDGSRHGIGMPPPSAIMMTQQHPGMQMHLPPPSMGGPSLASPLVGQGPKSQQIQQQPMFFTGAQMIRQLSVAAGVGDMPEKLTPPPTPIMPFHIPTLTDKSNNSPAAVQDLSSSQSKPHGDGKPDHDTEAVTVAVAAAAPVVEKDKEKPKKKRSGLKAEALAMGKDVKEVKESRELKEKEKDKDTEPSSKHPTIDSKKERSDLSRNESLRLEAQRKEISQYEQLQRESRPKFVKPKPEEAPSVVVEPSNLKRHASDHSIENKALALGANMSQSPGITRKRYRTEYDENDRPIQVEVNESDRPVDSNAVVSLRTSSDGVNHLGNGNPSNSSPTIPRKSGVGGGTSLPPSEALASSPTGLASASAQNPFASKDTMMLSSNLVSAGSGGKSTATVDPTAWTLNSFISGMRLARDDRAVIVVEFLASFVTSPQIEVEVKVGTLASKDSSQRVLSVLPVLSETAIHPSSAGNVVFHSEMALDVFKRLNQQMNARVQASMKSPNKADHVKYKRTKEEVVLHKDKIRVITETRKTADGKEEKVLVGAQHKQRIEDINFISPEHPFDFRVSASVEEMVEMPPSHWNHEGKRIKDRMSYVFDIFSFDITSVQNIGKPGVAERRTYEVEIEILPAAKLFEEAERHRVTNGNESGLYVIAYKLLHNVRQVLDFLK